MINKIVHDEYSKIPEHYSKTIHQIVASLLEKDPEKRPNIIYLLQVPEVIAEVKQGFYIIYS